MFFRLSSVVLVFALVVLGTPVKRDAATVESDIQGLAKTSTTLDNNIKAFPNSGGTVKEVFVIHQTAMELASGIVTATDDVNASPTFTDEQSTTFVQSVQTFSPVVVAACDDLVSKKSAIQGAGAGPVALSDLKTLNNNTNSFWAAVLAKITADQQGALKALIDKITAALTNAINEYS